MLKQVSQQSFSRRMLFGFAAMALTLVLLVTLVFVNVSRLAEAEYWSTHTYQVLLAAQGMEEGLLSMESGIRGFTLTANEEFLEPYHRGRKNFEKRLQEVRSLTLDSTEQQRRLTDLNEKYRNWSRQQVNPLLAMRRKTKDNRTAVDIAAWGAPSRKKTQDAMHGIIGEISNVESALLKERSAVQQQRTEETEITLIAGAAFLILLTVTLATRLAGNSQQLHAANSDLQEEVKEREQAEEALRATTGLQRAILNSTDYIIMSADAAGLIDTFNAAAQNKLGYSSDEVVGQKTLIQLHDPEELVSYAQGLTAELGRGVEAGFDALVGKARLGVVDENEWTYIRKDGSRFPVLLSVTALHDEAGRVNGYVGIASDITERKKVEKMKNEFISTVSHELRTPLTSIRGSLGLVSGGVAGEIPAQAKAMVEIAYKNSERLVRLINDILDIEKIESGKMDFVPRVVELGPLLEQALEANKGYAQQYKVCFDLQMQPGAGASKVYADADRLMQVLANLLSNAAKFSPANEVIEVKVECREPLAASSGAASGVGAGGMVRVTVADKGAGIPEEFRGRIFQKFAQADSSDTRQKGGTGLGLSISKALIERMGGKIGFTSHTGQGTSFFFDLPVYKEPSGESVGNKIDGDVHLNGAGHTPQNSTGGIAAEGIKAATTSLAQAVSDSPPVNGKHKRILICEDDADVANLLGIMLEKAGFETDVALNVLEAKGLLARHQSDGMTLDIALPDQDGITFIRDLRSHDETRSLPIVVVSARAEQGRHELNGDAVGIIDWMQKPIVDVHLVEAVTQATRYRGGRPCILHVEDDVDVVRVVAAILKDVADVTTAGNVHDAKRCLTTKKYDLVVLDIDLPDGSGTELLPLLSSSQPPVPVVIFSAQDTAAEAAHSIAGTLVKSRTSNQELLDSIKAIVGVT